MSNLTLRSSGPAFCGPLTTGQAIVRAIVAGERDAATLARLRDRRIKADEAQVAAALQGHWRDEHLFALKQALA